MAGAAASALVANAPSAALAWKKKASGKGLVQNNTTLPYGVECQFINMFGGGANGFTGVNPTFDMWALVNADNYPQSLPGGNGSISTGYQQGWLRTGDTLVVTWSGDATFNDPYLFVFGSGTLSVSRTVNNANRMEFTVTPTGVNNGDQIQWIMSIASIPTSLSNLKVFWSGLESLLNAGQLCNPDFLTFNRPWGRERFMDWMGTNGSSQYSVQPIVRWDQRTTQNNSSKFGYGIIPKYYAGQAVRSAGTNTFLAGTNPHSSWNNPSSWTNGEWVTCIPKFMVITSISNHATAPVVTTSASHGMSVGDTVVFRNLPGSFSAMCPANDLYPDAPVYLVTVVTSTTFTIATQAGAAVDTSGYGSYSGSTGTCVQTPSFQVITAFTNAVNGQITTATDHHCNVGDEVFFPNTSAAFGGNGGTNYHTYIIQSVVDSKNYTINADTRTWGTYSANSMNVGKVFKIGTASLTPKRVVATSANDIGYWNLPEPNMHIWGYLGNTFVYNSTLDVLLLAGTIGQGISVENLVKVCNEIGPGVDPWVCLPIMAEDNYVTQFATYIRDNLNSSVKTVFELGNEVWNLSFPGTGYAWAMQKALFSTSGFDLWYGYRFSQVMTLIGTVYGSQRSSRVIRMLANWAITAQAPTTIPSNLTDRFEATGTGVTAPYLLADSACYAAYITLDWSAGVPTSVVWAGVYGNTGEKAQAMAYLKNRYLTDSGGNANQQSIQYFNGSSNNGQSYNWSWLVKTHYGIAELSQYEGGQQAWVSVIGLTGSNPYTPPRGSAVTITNNDRDQLFLNFMESQEWADVLMASWAGHTAVGGAYPSVFCAIAEGTETAGAVSFMYRIINSNLYGPKNPAYYAIRQFNGK